MMYTEEQLQRLEELRADRERDRLNKQKEIEWRNKQATNKLKVGDPVFVTLEGKTVSGYIVKEREAYRYDVSTPHGVIEGLDYGSVRRRVIMDLSNVEVPEELKSKSTMNLLGMLQGFRSGNWSVLRRGITEEQVRAELKNRPHVPTKGEKKVFEKYKK